MWTLPRAMSAVVGFRMAALGMNGEFITGVAVCFVGGGGAPAFGISTVVVWGVATWGTVICGTSTVDEYGTGLFVTARGSGHCPHAMGAQANRIMSRRSTPGI